MQNYHNRPVFLCDFREEPGETECYEATWSAGAACRKCDHTCYRAGWTKDRVLMDNKLRCEKKNGGALRPASKLKVVPCPRCGATWPVVQAFWETQPDKTRRLVCCCSHCGITGKIEVSEKAGGES